MRKNLAAFAAVCSLALVSACGASGGSDNADDKSSDTTEATTAKTTETTEAEAEALAVDEWAADFCGNFSDWLDAIQAASSDVGNQVTPGDIESGKTALVNLFGTASEETQTLITSLEDGGAPDIDDGQGLVDELVSRFEDFDQAAQDAQATAQDLTTDDVATFQADAEELTKTFQDEVTTVGDSFAEIDTMYPDQELQSALTESCDF